MRNSFETVAATEQNPKWKYMISRQKPIYKRIDDIRTDFARDYTRILHCNAYRRLKHKTQVFFSPSSDHVCTRIEHVGHVESISNTIATYLGLNTELTKAISISHDLGHSPFGHAGEKILNEISMRDINQSFWHEKNGVHFVDNIELLEDDKGNLQNLNLTYAIRDGIISHCGEIDENALKPRDEVIDLAEYSKPNQFNPYTWEACVIKISDKISYIGRDLEDALHLHLLDKTKIEELKDILKIPNSMVLNNTNIINELIIDLCKNSSIENGLCFSNEKLKLIDSIKAYNYQNIYSHPRLDASNEYFRIVINRIYETLKSAYTPNNLEDSFKKLKKFYPQTITGFGEYLYRYSELNDRRKDSYLLNKVVYKNTRQDYLKAIIDFIAGMTDNYAIDIYNEILKF